jgi:ribosomal protein S9
LKKSLIVIALVVAGVVGVGYYYWQQATFLPNWYSETSADKNSQESVTDASNINRNLNRQKTKGEIQLNQEELNNLITDNLAKDNRLKQVLPATKAINSDIKDGKLEIGAIVNTSKLSQLNLKESERAIIEQIMQKVPQLQNRDIYVGIQGTPQIKDGKIILGQESQVKVGKLSFTIPEIAQKLNLPAAKLQQDLALDVGQLNLQDIEINQGEIKLKMGTQ